MDPKIFDQEPEEVENGAQESEDAERWCEDQAEQYLETFND